MKIGVNWFWRDRLKDGKIFSCQHFKEPGYDYKAGTSADWPIRVAKESLFKDYVEWAHACHFGNVEHSEFFRVLQPLIYVYGNKAHSTRNSVPKKFWAKERLLDGRVQRAFFKLAPLDVCKAHARLVWNEGTVTEQTLDRLLIARQAHRFVREWTDGALSPQTRPDAAPMV